MVGNTHYSREVKPRMQEGVDVGSEISTEKHHYILKTRSVPATRNAGASSTKPEHLSRFRHYFILPLTFMNMQGSGRGTYSSVGEAAAFEQEREAKEVLSPHSLIPCKRAKCPKSC